ncbi:MAG: hypothetical protein IPP88_25205 [Betaproteobacteria bacterium]|nr:hypothetical protein [Betaproteobacteria bacterium]
MTVASQNGSPSYASLLAMHELATRLSSQVNSAHMEIGETRAILKDAIDRLMPAFTAMRAQDVVAVMNPSKREAFAALQFQDISDQLLAHAQTRLASLLNEVNLAVEALQPGGMQDDATAKLARLVEQANDNLAALDISLHKPVDNAHLASGEIELF